MNHWGEPDEVDFPDWMLPDNHPNKRKTPVRTSTKSFEDAIKEAMSKPSIPINDKLIEDMMHAATHMSDKGYELSTHEKQQEFAKKRNEII